MAYDAITSGEADANSPADATLWGKVKGNFDDLDAARVTNGDSHDHSGGDGAAIPQGGIGASAVGRAELKTAQGTVASISDVVAPRTLPGGEYGFYPRIKMVHVGVDTWDATILPTAVVAGWTSFVTTIALGGDSSSNATTAQQRYIQSSPPYMLGDTEWGHFLFLLRKFGTGEVVSSYEAEDPPWAYNGKIWLPKDHVDRISEVPHPFMEYWTRDPATDGLEIVLVNLASIGVTEWIADNWKVGKSILEDLGSVLAGKGVDKPWSNYNVPTISRFTDRVKVITP